MPWAHLLALELASEEFPAHLLSAAWIFTKHAPTQARITTTVPWHLWFLLTPAEWAPAHGYLLSESWVVLKWLPGGHFSFSSYLGIFELWECIIAIHVTLFQIFTYSHEICPKKQNWIDCVQNLVMSIIFSHQVFKKYPGYHNFTWEVSPYLLTVLKTLRGHVSLGKWRFIFATE